MGDARSSDVVDRHSRYFPLAWEYAHIGDVTGRMDGYLVSNLPPIPQQDSSAVSEEADEDDESSYASFAEELNRKEWGTPFNDALNNLVDKMLPLVGLKPKETNLKRAEGCLT